MSERKIKFTEIVKDYPHFLIRKNAMLVSGGDVLSDELKNIFSFQLRKLDEIPQDKADFQEYLEFNRKIQSLGQPIKIFYEPQSRNLADLIEETREPLAFAKYQINADDSFSNRKD